MGNKSSKKKAKALDVASDKKSASPEEQRKSARQKQLQIVDAGTPSASDADFNIKVGNRWYAVHNAIGMGGFSQVFIGVDVITKKRVALKILGAHEKNKGDKKTQLSQAQKEIKAMKIFDHPNVVRLLGYDLRCNVNGNESIVIIQQLCPKGELFDYLMHTKQFTPPAAKALFKQLMSGLKHMHDRGIAHRDLKPENLLFDRDYNLKLVDFGFAFAFEKRGEKRTMQTELGTKGYMAPEVLANKQAYTKKCDIFSAGVIFFIMLAGFPPFQHANKDDWWFNKLMKRNYPLFWKAHERTAKFEKQAKHLLIKMMAPKEKDRYDTDEVLAHDYLSTGAMNKGELRAEMERRKEIINHSSDDNRAAFQTLLEANLDNLVEKEGYGVLLRSLITNKFVDSLKAVGNEEYGENQKFKSAVQHLTTKLKAVAGDFDTPDTVVAEIEERVGSLSDERAIEIAEILRTRDIERLKALGDVTEKDGEGGGATPAEKRVFPPKICEALIKRVKETQIGSVDDWDKVHRALDYEDSEVSLPRFTPHDNGLECYRTKVGFGILAYMMLQVSKKLYGSLTIDIGTAEIILELGRAKQFEMPKLIPKSKETQDKMTNGFSEDAEIGEEELKWGKLQVDMELKISVSLKYAEEQNANVLVIKNLSKGFARRAGFLAVEQLKASDFLGKIYIDHIGLNAEVLGEDEIFSQKLEQWTLVQTAEYEAIRLTPDANEEGKIEVQKADGTRLWILEKELIQSKAADDNVKQEEEVKQECDNVKQQEEEVKAAVDDLEEEEEDAEIWRKNAAPWNLDEDSMKYAG